MLPSAALLWGAATALAAVAAGGPGAVLLWVAALLLVVLGLAGTVLPGILPGAPLVFLGLLAAAAADGFERVGWVTLCLVGLLAVAAVVFDAWATLLGARRSGASVLATVGAALGTFVGLFFSLPGVLLGPFIGAFVGELLARRELRQAGRAGLGAWIGMLLALALRSAAVLLMLGLFAFSYALG
jgi:uncharacterized protein YqgC (DUF456 family)